jgi:hypothetical protein
LNIADTRPTTEGGFSMRIVPAAILLVSMTTIGLADRKAADVCATKLTPISKQIYEVTLASNPTPATGRSLVVSETEKLIAQGKVSMGEARPAAEAAGQCLELLGQ